MNHREAFRDIKNLRLQLHSTPASQCYQPALKSVADVINGNQKLLQSTVIAGHLAVQLARYSYFGEDVMKISTVSSLPNEKLKRSKHGYIKSTALTTKWNLNHCGKSAFLIAIGKACQALRAKDVATDELSLACMYMSHGNSNFTFLMPL